MSQSPPEAPAPPPFDPAGPPPVPYAFPMPLGYAAGVYMPYVSARGRARVVIVLSCVVIACQLAMTWPQLEHIDELRAVAAGGPASDGLSTTDWVLIGTGVLTVVVSIVLVVFWMMWVHRTYRNLQPLGALGLAYSPGWAVGYYFIPILNLFRPYQVMAETWRASDPRHGGGEDWRRMAVPSLIGWWWAAHIISMVLTRVSFRIEMRSEDPGVLLGVAWLDFALLFFDSGLLLMEIWIVKRLTGLQELRAGSFGTVQAAPTAVPYPGLNQS